MKTIITLLLVCITYSGFGKSKQAYEKLCEVNKCWTEQPDVQQLAYPVYDNRNEREWIRTHLSMVEQTLRTRSTAHLSAQQQANRLNALAHLNQYWREGNFPINDQYNYRTPIFIDKYDNFCAVGYLVKATGYEQVSRKIAAQTNLAYVREMNYPELFSWANEYGFTVDELAWIQPGYPPVNSVKSVGGGTDGEVFELYPDKAGDKLYVGGIFKNVDDNIPANNIAYVTENEGVYTWHTMGDGIEGEVYAITEFGNKIYIGGSFTSGGSHAGSVACWDGSAWQYLGCIGPVVKDLIVFDNKLYAVGDFNVCAALTEVNFAVWDGIKWQQVPGLEGHVNTVHNAGDKLILGGNFTYMGANENIIKWIPGQGFVQYGNSIVNEVNDIEVNNNSLFVVTTATADTNQLALKLNTADDTWSALQQMQFKGVAQLGIKTLCSKGHDLFVGGDIIYEPLIQPSMSSMNCAIIYQGQYLSGYDGVLVDSAINVIVTFRNKLVVGGKFNSGYSGQSQFSPVNSIAAQASEVGVKPLNDTKEIFNIYPNPVAAGREVTVENNFDAKYFKLYNVAGKLIINSDINNSGKIELQQLPPGMYMAELSNNSGKKAVSKIVIE